MSEKSQLGELLIAVKVSHAKVRRSKNLNSSAYDDFTDKVSKLYSFLDHKPIGEIERLCR